VRSVSFLRSVLYGSARALGDAQAISKGPTAVLKRVERRALGRLASAIIRKVVGS
jgi:hypothetical protein